MSSVEITGSTVNLTVWSETDNLIEVQLLDSSTGDPINISSDTVTFVARSRPEGTIKVGPLSNASGSHADASSGKTRFKLDRSSLVLSTPSKPETWSYEVRRSIGGTGDQIIYIHGSLTVFPNVGV